jgi:vesicle-associated membrane protein 72
MQRELEYCAAHPQEVSRAAALQGAVAAVKGVAAANADSAAAPPASALEPRPLSFDAAVRFRRKGEELRARLWWRSARVRACIICGALSVLAIIVGMAACFGGEERCLGGNKIPPKEGVGAGARPGPLPVPP